MTKADNVLIRDEMSERIIRTAEEIALTDGTDNLTVRKLLNRLGITNRVFYNRFRNIEEVLSVVYENTVKKMRTCIKESLDAKKDYFEQIMELVSQVVEMSYDTRRRMSGFVFGTDLTERENRDWWTAEIRRLIVYGMENGYLRSVEPDVLSYSIWCFIRGYNADVIARGVPKDEAVNGLRYTFTFILDGLKAEETA